MDGSLGIRGAVEASDEKPSERDHYYEAVFSSDLPQRNGEDGTAHRKLTPHPNALQ
jgi:hypothetical protein